MKSKRTFAFIVIMLAAISAVAIFRNPKTVEAQDTARPETERISFGMLGITAGQTLRIGVTDTAMPNDIGLPPGPVRVVLNFRNGNAQLVRDRNGEVIRRAIDLERGRSTFLDLNYDELPPGPVRIQFRAVVVAIQPPAQDNNEQPPPTEDRITATVEVINNANGRTQFAVFTHPAVARGFNPQPDPPIE